MKRMLASFLLIGIFSVAHGDQSDFIDNGIFTTDSSTGLDWLDLTETSGRSWEDVHYDVHDYSDREINNVFSVSDGWRIASTVEVLALTINWAGNAPYTLTQYGLPRESTYDLVLYPTGTFDGLVDLLGGGTGHTRRQTCASFGNGYVIGNDDYLNCSSTDTRHSTFLVRTAAVPEVDSIYLLAFGLLGLFGAARRKV